MNGIRGDGITGAVPRGRPRGSPGRRSRPPPDPPYQSTAAPWITASVARRPTIGHRSDHASRFPRAVAMEPTTTSRAPSRLSPGSGGASRSAGRRRRRMEAPGDTPRGTRRGDRAFRLRSGSASGYGYYVEPLRGPAVATVSRALPRWRRTHRRPRITGRRISKMQGLEPESWLDSDGREIERQRALEHA